MLHKYNAFVAALCSHPRLLPSVRKCNSSRMRRTPEPLPVGDRSTDPLIPPGGE